MTSNSDQCGSVQPCSPKPNLETRDLLDEAQARAVAELFKVLGSETRLRLLHALIRHGEITVTALGESLGMTPQAVSNQLQRLADRGIVGTRREGTKIHYRLVDLCVYHLLDRGICLSEEAAQRVLSTPFAKS